jgi:hypothetical protein
MVVEFEKIVVGEYADYLDTGIWTIKDGKLIPPEDLTEQQLKDFKRVFGELFVRKIGGQ